MADVNYASALVDIVIILSSLYLYSTGLDNWWWLLFLILLTGGYGIRKSD